MSKQLSLVLAKKQLTPRFILAILLCFASFSIQAQSTCVAPPPGLVSWWPGDGNTNDLADDNIGTLQNGAAFATGKVGQAFSFDNVDDYVEFPTDGFVSSAMTIDLWFNLTSWNGHDDLVQLSTDGNNANRISLERGNDFSGCAGDRIFLITGDARGSIRLLCTSTSFALGTWYHVAASFDNTGNTSIYVNGILENSATSANVPGVIAPSFFVGRNFANETSRLFHGLIDEVDVFDRVLDADEIAAIYNADSAGKCTESETCFVVKAENDNTVTFCL